MDVAFGKGGGLLLATDSVVACCCYMIDKCSIKEKCSIYSSGKNQRFTQQSVD
jgi:hypothetical protein